MKKSISLVSLLFFSIYATALTLPNGSFDSNEGNSNSGVPFNGDAQLQMIYESSLFSGPITIRGLRVRVNNGASGTFSSANYKIDMSSSTTNTTNFVSTFNSNHGSDRTTVLNSPLTFDYLNGVSDLIDINPFDYDPTSGNSLIIHFFNFDNGNTGGFSFDRETSSAAAGTVFAFNGDPNVSTASFTRVSDSVILELETSLGEPSVPEPATCFLLLLAALGFSSKMVKRT